MKLVIGVWAGILALVVAGGAATSASAQEAYPHRVIKFVSPFPAGGTTDIVGRVLAQRMSQSLGQPVIVENKAGAAGAIGAVTVAQARPDGYTALIGPSSTIAINPHVSQISYDVDRDFRPVGLIMKAETLIVAHPSKGFNSLQDVIAYARRNPGKLTFGSFGPGSSAHLVMAHLQAVAGIELLHVPYKGAAPAELALVAGEIDLLVVNTVSSLPHIEAGKMTPIALISSAASQIFPKLAKSSELFPDFIFDTWLALYVPAKTSDQIINRLNASMIEALTEPKLVQELRSKGIEPAPGSPSDLVAFQSIESERWANAAASAKAHGRLD
jgi:tripartite-type tricarboxylate transporter receptor subunit TctC